MVLRELTALRGVAGDEGAVRGYIRQRAEALADSVHLDRMGNVIAHKKGTGASKAHVLISAHMDEVGFIVRGIGEDGLLSMLPAGAVDPRIAISKRVQVGPSAVNGVIGAKAIHLQTPAERERVLPMDELYIDIGAKNRAAAEALVSPGDYVTFDSEWVEFGDGLVKVRALDDRVGCATMLRILEGTYPVDITCAFASQEEAGTRGSKAIGHMIQADCAIVLEGTSANDLGMVDDALKVCRVGHGVAISFMDLSTIAHPGLNRALRELATERGIAWQVKSYVSGGNDSGSLQRGAGGMATCVLSVPCRYIHSASSVANLSDIEAQYQLTDAFLASGAKF